jgi:hypothetical protein
MSTALAKQGGGWAIAPANMGELFNFAKMLSESDLVPKDYQGKPSNCMVAIQMGGELGLSPMQSIQNIAVINGRPSLWGDAMLAVCLPHLDSFEESDDGATATCVATRGNRRVSNTFSTEDAKRASLADKSGPWKQYPARMRKLRARGFTLRDICADVLRGVQSAEETQDIPREVRAEVVEPPAVQAPQEPPPDTRLRGIGNGPLAGKVLEECTFEELGHYIARIEKLAPAKRAPFETHLKAAGEVFDRLAAREVAKVTTYQPPSAAEPDPIAEGLEREVKRLREPGDDDDSYLSGGAP